MKLKLTKKLGMILLSIWLIVSGVIAIFNLSFTGLSIVMGILAIAAGVLILLDR